ncbi:class I SAM-dependent methyltransferase [Leptolyngbya sp. FACHB-321]|uniref:methyltransferase domain-containing protein n=1 Tax=Leptolyngbya sp. FACHB-321 TaxID=2692807 RepID=UPI0016877BBF|nr:class I SAM-dependent methyltransferase [Leptolyngbya sp. FACHB-321]
MKTLKPFTKLFSGARKPKQEPLELKPVELPKPVELLNEHSKHFLTERYSQKETSALNYATVRDFCDSADNMPQVCYLNGDLKNVQRPWTIKAVLGAVPLGGKLLEIGGGIPLVAGMLAELGYDVTLVDPYEGMGNGPTEYEAYAQQFPNVNLVRSYFNADLVGYAESSFDCIYSVSVLEHIPQQGIKEVFDGIHKFLKPGGFSIHCIDLVVQGNGTQYDEDIFREIFYRQKRLQEFECLRSDTDKQCDETLMTLKDDLETFYLSATGHHLWRCGQSYDDFPFRKVASLQTCIPYIAVI